MCFQAEFYIVSTEFAAFVSFMALAVVQMMVACPVNTKQELPREKSLGKLWWKYGCVILHHQDMKVVRYTQSVSVRISHYFNFRAYLRIFILYFKMSKTNEIISFWCWGLSSSRKSIAPYIAVEKSTICDLTTKWNQRKPLL